MLQCWAWESGRNLEKREGGRQVEDFYEAKTSSPQGTAKSNAIPNV